MIKKIIIVLCFVAVFAVALWYLFELQGYKDVQISENEISEQKIEEPMAVEEKVYSYTKETLAENCATDDKIFCAIEQTVKCTIDPDFVGCDKKNVPAFVLGKTDEVERPSTISFRIIKLKPVAGSSDVSVYTQSDCDALWFGLCKGTVVYSLTPGQDNWKVTNIFALVE